MQAKRIISFLLLCVFLFYITPKEIVHAFVTHTDTEHKAAHSKNHLEISAEHHHCELMKADQQFVSSGFSIPYYDFQTVCYFTKQTVLATALSIFSSVVNEGNPLRGPPVVS